MRRKYLLLRLLCYDYASNQQPESGMDRTNELLASAYNLHIGPKVGGAAMTPAKAARLSRGDKAALCRLLEAKGGSDLFTAADARAAFARVVS